PHDPLAPSAHDRVRSPSQIRGDLARGIFRGAHKGLQRFLANSASLPDGRTLCAIEGQPGTKRFDFFPLVWGSPFGACLRLILPTRRKAQAVFAVGDRDHIETLQEGKIVFAFYRLGRLVDLKFFDIASSTEANSWFRQLISMCKS